MPIMDRIKKHAPARRALLATHIGVSNTAQRMKAASALGEDDSRYLMTATALLIAALLV